MTWDRVKDGLTILVIPLVLWGVRLETTIAVQEEQIKTLETKISVTEQSIKRVEDAVQKNSLELVKVSGKLDSANEKIDVIKDILTRGN